MLNLYPIRQMEYEDNDGLVTVLFVNPNPSFIERKFFKKHIHKPYKVELDELGTFVWQLCNGKYNVAEIIQKFEHQFQENEKQANQRVIKFIQQMSKNKLIKLFEKKST